MGHLANSCEPTRARVRRIMGLETEYGLTAVADGRRALGPGELARYLFRPVVEKYASSNVFIPNGARLYLDVGAHPEYATAECDVLSQLVAQQSAGDRILDEMARAAEEALNKDGIAGAVYLLKNNVDSVGNSYGCHENYLVGREAVLKSLGRRLMAFLVTRQLVCGAGRIVPTRGGTPAQFVLSQRADQVLESVSSATTRSRPVINTRDEPHADSHRFRRMHVIVGDSNMAEPSTALKVGSMLLLLEMIEAGFELPDVELERPVVQGRDIARDLTGTRQLQGADGTTTCALDVQRGYADAAALWLEVRPENTGGTSTEEMARVVELWQRVLGAIAEEDFAAIAGEIDWAAKLKLIKAFDQRLGAGGDLSHPKLGQLDLAYHDIRAGRGLAGVLESRGRLSRWVSDVAVERARTSPPRTTRAHARGAFLARAERAGAAVAADWSHVKVNRPEPQTWSLDDPFVAEPAELAEMLAAVDAATPGAGACAAAQRGAENGD
ncbi:Pup--protein ligase [Corynebacterium atypicum]|uniref:Pup--protein ligase n=1 Tax=Corynebacterium atypicum TaxID=191610 RepID=UPI000690FBC7|nr:Pup--protein ligase [Corynebacterium atypicum]